MNEIKLFENQEFGTVRTIMIEGDPWFVGKDIAEALGYAKPTDAVRKRVEAEDRGVSKMETPSGTQEMTIINESGLYALIFGSKLESAKNFKRWVTSEVLPSLRKTVSYSVRQNEEMGTEQLQRIVSELISLLDNRYKRIDSATTPSVTEKTADQEELLYRIEWRRNIAQKIVDYSTQNNLADGALIYKLVYERFLSDGIDLNKLKASCGFYSRPTIFYIATIPEYRILFEQYLDEIITPRKKIEVNTWAEAQEIIPMLADKYQDKSVNYGSTYRKIYSIMGSINWNYYRTRKHSGSTRRLTTKKDMIENSPKLQKLFVEALKGKLIEEGIA